MTVEEAIQKEYDKCMHLRENPEESPTLFGINGVSAIVEYYTYRAEALGFALDKFSQERRGAL